MTNHVARLCELTFRERISVDAALADSLNHGRQPGC